MSVKLNVTGERFLPDSTQDGITGIEHQSRYLIAKQMVQGLNVLDIACGEGYGSSMLSDAAASVVGVDISLDAVSYAKEKYKRNNLKYIHGSASNIPVGDQVFDAVISFETIEHHEKHDEMMMEIKRVLKKDGFLLISSPDKQIYTEEMKIINQYHVKELYANEFIALIGKYFKNYKFGGQRVLFGSVCVWEDSAEKFIYSNARASNHVSAKLDRPVYSLCVASDAGLPKSSNAVFEMDVPLNWALVEKIRMSFIGAIVRYLKRLL
jgi:SAM-dependent methyltransferase